MNPINKATGLNDAENVSNEFKVPKVSEPAPTGAQLPVPNPTDVLSPDALNSIDTSAPQEVFPQPVNIPFAGAQQPVQSGADRYMADPLSNTPQPVGLGEQLAPASTTPGTPLPLSQYSTQQIVAPQLLPPADNFYEGPTADDVQDRLKRYASNPYATPIVRQEATDFFANPLGQDRENPFEYRPDSLRNAFKDQQNSPGFIAPWEQNWLGRAANNAMYVFGVGQNVALGAVADANNAIDDFAQSVRKNLLSIPGVAGADAQLSRLNDQLIGGIAQGIVGGRGINNAGNAGQQINAGIQDVLSGRFFVRPNQDDVRANGLNIAQALAGRNYQLFDDRGERTGAPKDNTLPEDGNSVIRFKRGFEKPFGFGIAGVPWYRDPGFFGGVIANVFVPAPGDKGISKATGFVARSVGGLPIIRPTLEATGTFIQKLPIIRRFVKTPGEPIKVPSGVSIPLSELTEPIPPIATRLPTPSELGAEILARRTPPVEVPQVRMSRWLTQDVDQSPFTRQLVAEPTPNLAVKNTGQPAPRVAMPITPVSTEQVGHVLAAPKLGVTIPELIEAPAARSLADVDNIAARLTTADGRPLPEFGSWQDVARQVDESPELAHALSPVGVKVPEGRVQLDTPAGLVESEPIRPSSRPRIEAAQDNLLERYQKAYNLTDTIDASVNKFKAAYADLTDVSMARRVVARQLESLQSSLDEGIKLIHGLPDIGRRTIKQVIPWERDLSSVNRQIPFEFVKRQVNEFFHGTKVELPFDRSTGKFAGEFDPVGGGARGTMGTGFYLSHTPDYAGYYARAVSSKNVPLVSAARKYTDDGLIHMVTVDNSARLLPADLSEAPLARQFITDAILENIPAGQTRTSYKAWLTRVKPTSYPKMLDKATEYMSKNFLWSEASVLDMQRKVSDKMRVFGVDGFVGNGETVILNPEKLKINSSTVIPNVGEVNSALARFNADSVTASRYPNLANPAVDMAESSKTALSQMIDGLADTKSNLYQLTREKSAQVNQLKEQLSKSTAQKIQETEAKIKRQVDQLDAEYRKTETDPCGF